MKSNIGSLNTPANIASFELNTVTDNITGLDLIGA